MQAASYDAFNNMLFLKDFRNSEVKEFPPGKFSKTNLWQTLNVWNNQINELPTGVFLNPYFCCSVLTRDTAQAAFVSAT